MTARSERPTMIRQFRALQRRFGSDRPGLQLIAVEDAAIPVTVIRADTLAQEKKELPITEEFTLRFIYEGVDEPGEIAAYLGLDATHILDAAAEQLSEGHIRRTAGDRLALNPIGVEVVSTLAATKPVLRQLPVAFDRLTWKLADYPERALIQKKEAQERGLTLLPAARNAHIGLDDVTPAEFNRLLKAESQDRLQVLRIHKVQVKRHLYLPVELLIYGDETRSEIELAVCIDDDLAEDHGIALDRIGAVDRLGLKLAAAEPRPVLEDELEIQRSGREDTNSDEVVADSPAEEARSGVTGLVRSISVFEHADLLTEALDTAKTRLLIISPWVKNAVVTTDFIARLEKRLRAKVQVTIAHGIGDNDDDSNASALRRLQNLAARYDNFDFVRLENTHAKILIFDDCWVSTSFNWLSFRGDPDRTYRMEEGTLVAMPKKVQEAYERYLALINEQKRA
jgi:hypothetical protein